jgi:hypothetical protein
VNLLVKYGELSRSFDWPGGLRARDAAVLAGVGMAGRLLENPMLVTADGRGIPPVAKLAEVAIDGDRLELLEVGGGT